MNKTYCIADLHGNYNAWTKVKNKIDENDTLYVLGDAIDRGKDGIKILFEIKEMKNVIFLIGNHEQFMMDWYCANKEGVLQTHQYLMDWFNNGGVKTYEDFLALEGKKQEELINYLFECSCFETIENKNGDLLLLSHSGFATTYKEKMDDVDTFIWNRNHLSEKEWGLIDNVYMIFGHTPVQYLGASKSPEHSVRLCNGHKIDIDLGCIWTDKCAFLNLDTLEEEIL